MKFADINLDMVKKYRDIVEKANNKIIGKKKYQNEYSSEIQSYYNALKNLTDCGIASRSGLIYQKNNYEKQLENEKLVLDAQLKKYKADLNLVFSVLVAISNTVDKERNQEWHKNYTKRIAKAKTKEIDMEDYYDL